MVDNSLNNKLDDYVMIYPTDTVWGIGASIYSEKGILDMHRIKQSDPSKPVSILFPSLALLIDFFDFEKLKISKKWLERFFKLETTLGIPKKYLLKDIPHWVTGDSDFVCCRFLEDSLLKEFDVPITTTSLNISGNPPIENTGDAKDFFSMFSGDYKINFFNTDILSLSGHSSTILFVKDVNQFEYIREGFQIENVKEHVRLLTT